MFEWLTSAKWSGISGIVDLLTFFRDRKKAKDQERSARHTLPNEQVYSLVERFISVYKSHGVDRTQIPRFLGEEFTLALADVSNNEKLLYALDEKIVNATCELFGIRRGWLDGHNERIYDTLMVYKDLPRFVRFIRELKEQYPEKVCFLYAYKSTKASPDLFKSRPEISLVFAAPITDIDQRTIYRYYPLHGPFPWDHAPARFSLIAYFTLAFATPGLTLKGVDVTHKLIGGLAEGKIIPETVSREGIWHPEDYAFSSACREMPIDSKEISAFWEYITANGWLGYFNRDIIPSP